MIFLGLIGLLGAAIFMGAGWLFLRQLAPRPLHEATQLRESLQVAVIPKAQRVAGRVRQLTPLIQAKIQIADKIEYDIRGDQQALAKVQMYAKRIEDWRTDVGQFLAAELPNSGADTKFLTFTPTVGQGPIIYEYQRLIQMRANLVSILDGLESFAQRSL